MDKQTYLQIRNKLNFANNLALSPTHIFLDIFLAGFIVGCCWFLPRSPVLILTWIPIAIFMFRSFAMMHEAVHGVASASPANDWIGIFYGGLALLPFEPWKKSHMEHHFWSGNAERDPVMALLIVYPKLAPWLQKSLSFGWKRWLPVMAILQHLVFWFLSIQKCFHSKLSLKMLMSMAWPIFFWIIVLTQVPVSILFLVIVPSMFVYLIWVEIVNLPHHLRLPQLSGNARLPIWKQFQSSRSCIYPQWIEELVTLNFNYHSEHHMFPDLAWHQLANVHQLMKENLGSRLNMDIQFSWTVTNRKNNLDYLLANEKIMTTESVVKETQIDLCQQNLQS